MLAIVGPTGVGKTTTINLLARFYEPEEGVILIDGQSISDLTIDSLRDHMSIVLQDVFLFNGTIAENIAYGFKNATPEQIIEAAKIDHIHDFIAVSYTHLDVYKRQERAVSREIRPLHIRLPVSGLLPALLRRHHIKILVLFEPQRFHHVRGDRG